MVVTYHIEKVTLIRENGDYPVIFSWQTSEFVTDLKQYRMSLKDKYRVNKVQLTYTTIDK
jgi:hypothetical protein